MSLPSPAAASLRDAALIFLVATVLGLGFNAVSPLGVRHAPAEPNAVATPTPRAVTRGVQNETLSITIEESAPTPRRGAMVPSSVTWPQAKALVEQGGAVLVDARDARAFAAGHIPGAISLPMNFSVAQIEAFKAKYPKEKTVIVYCASSQCAISRALAQLLAERHGYLDARDLPGGYVEWRLAEYAAAAGAAEKAPQ
jgi:rhodanese-related sulfurtransferase